MHEMIRFYCDARQNRHGRRVVEVSDVIVTQTSTLGTLAIPIHQCRGDHRAWMPVCRQSPSSQATSRRRQGPSAAQSRRLLLLVDVTAPLWSRQLGPPTSPNGPTGSAWLQLLSSCVQSRRPLDMHCKAYGRQRRRRYSDIRGDSCQFHCEYC